MTQPTAVDFKNQGNKALLESKYEEAIELYTKAINLDSTNAVFFANRAQAHIKSEAYGSAIADASEAIKLDPSYTKAYYRRAVAKTAIVRYKDALPDFKVTVDRAPNDKDAKARYLECQKIVRRLAFEKAIEVEDEPSVAETLDIRSLKVEDSYDGPELDIEFVKEADSDKFFPKVNMTKEFITQTIERFKVGKLLPRKYLYAIVLQAMKLFQQEPTMVEIKAEMPDHLITICGDTHGQFFDLLEIFRKNGEPSENHMYLFNGDFVDRGSWSCEIALTLYAYKILYPSSFFINRGNHETDSMNKVYGFEGECKHKYVSESVFKLFSESFSLLPLATLVSDQYFVVHGGLFSDDNVTLDDIRKFNRFSEKQPGMHGIMMEMLWTDPQPEPGRGPSKRGIGIQFGPDVTDRFCKANGLKAVIRSHEVRMGGYSEEHDGKLITVFSAPNYCDSQGNKGAYINVREDGELNFVTFDAVPHPDIKPMRYASQLMGM
ncbi:Ppt1p [Sugiyamaella lignohabitans]|uniref:Serine/threonine-protein phosphatase n=1 Tax=Sugiyamaella lignohabitans TaxID=796027 RepID=A0A167E224_9ASCO|nr:Ppt1p [Sugiyamaella lignohabitans]ANB13553.1 Ppt1p [Sugiyamaella lignohabitans]